MNTPHLNRNRHPKSWDEKDNIILGTINMEIVTDFTFQILKSLKLALKSMAANTSIVTQLLH